MVCVLILLYQQWQGVYISISPQWISSWRCRDSEIQSNVLKSMLLNSLALASIYTFDLLLRPLVQDQQAWFQRNIGWFYQIFWVMPVIGISLYLNVCNSPTTLPSTPVNLRPRYRALGLTSSREEYTLFNMARALWHLPNLRRIVGYSPLWPHQHTAPS